MANQWKTKARFRRSNKATKCRYPLLFFLLFLLALFLGQLYFRTITTTSSPGTNFTVFDNHVLEQQEPIKTIPNQVEEHQQPSETTTTHFQEQQELVKTIPNQVQEHQQPTETTTSLVPEQQESVKTIPDQVQDHQQPTETTTSHVPEQQDAMGIAKPDQDQYSSCHLGGVKVYMYEVPPKFNVGMLEDCEHLNMHINMCPHTVNHGLGWPLSSATLTTSNSTDSVPRWYATNQFLAEMIFHARLENHPCRTHEPNEATLFYVPFYGGLYASSKFGEANYTARDELAMKLIAYLWTQPMWWIKGHQGHDHFFVLGRTAWDFMRSESGPDFGANSFLNHPYVQNASVLTIERNPWGGGKQFGIPYPSYFHPCTITEMASWQDEVRTSERPYLFSYVGAPRKGGEKVARDELVRQCNESKHCLLVTCGPEATDCYEPLEVMKVMKQSDFCLQAPGNSFTHRSTFDSMLAGCVPVFVSPHTAYTQYMWYLPQEGGKYSVFIDEKEVLENGNVVEEVLLKISRERRETMRSNVIDLIPRITYKHPNCNNGGDGFVDAVDVSLMELDKFVRSKLRVI